MNVKSINSLLNIYGTSIKNLIKSRIENKKAKNKNKDKKKMNSRIVFVEKEEVTYSIIKKFNLMKMLYTSLLK